ncbi:DUF3389 family protein [Vibrio genomosp. F10]|uniref:PTS sugar transporter subunit IIA n=1 Tax=Vibrio genomosp. F10 TaxID=723171 RepID=A0A1B9QV11_9VIBR|nr:DUF3389 family protein [Vibrio genomosp. F10]OCH72440.1 PTS sugar transporter subunit IIA [Vibrio genomosp. F10]OEF10533.1 PTS sugar transporter subunit IIA [Vibrio genomosp. F10 str. 9ZB36]
MVITFSLGKIIATAHELIVKFDGQQQVVLQAQADCLTLIGKGTNVLVANGSGCKWSLKLDNEQQVNELSMLMGCAVSD